jgi:glucose-6-phosphate 1-epimerase
MHLSDSTSITTKQNIQVLEIDNAFAQASLSLFGGHLLSFKPKHDQRERLWLSENAKLDAQHAIRGGTPICWPWFGDHQATRNNASDKRFPAHGYVRKQQWKIIECHDEAGTTHVSLQPSTSQGEGFLGKVELTLILKFGKQLSMQLLSKNIGESAFDYTCALHTYFAINDIHSCELRGLSGNYSDKTRDWQLLPTPSPYVFSEETDRVHLSTPKKVSIVEGKTNTDVNSEGHDSMVVWNPWAENSQRMEDMTDEGYATMLCVETAITQGHRIAPGQSHTLEQVIT